VALQDLHRKQAKLSVNSPALYCNLVHCHHPVSCIVNFLHVLRLTVDGHQADNKTHDVRQHQADDQHHCLLLEAGGSLQAARAAGKGWPDGAYVAFNQAVMQQELIENGTEKAGPWSAVILLAVKPVASAAYLVTGEAMVLCKVHNSFAALWLFILLDHPWHTRVACGCMRVG